MNYKGTLLGYNHMLIRYISDTRTQGADDLDPLGGYPGRNRLAHRIIEWAGFGWLLFCTRLIRHKKQLQGGLSQSLYRHKLQATPRARSLSALCRAMSSAL